MIYKCECGSEFDNSQKFNGHKAQCKIHFFNKYGSLDKYNKLREEANNILLKNNIKSHLEAKQRNKEKEKKNLQQWISEQHICEKCGKVMTEKFGSGRFCSQACANSRKHSEETKNKIAKSVTNTYIQKPNKYMIDYLTNPKLCKCCGKPISYKLRHRKCCSDECAKKLQYQGALIGGKLAQQIEVRRSKNEIYFYELCEKYFKNVRHNEPIFNGWDADIIIDDIKYAVLWNGPWHYRQIKKDHSVKQVQNRDNIKIEEIKKAGYIPYAIKDDGKYKKSFVEEQFKIFINNIV